MKETLRLPIRDLIGTPEEDQGLLLENHFLGAKINAGPKMVPGTLKTGANSAV